MFFNSFHYLIFLPVVVGLFYAVPGKFRWGLLLAASYYFYLCWKVEYIVLILISTLVCYFTTRSCYSASSLTQKRIYLGINVTVNLGILFFFKYFNFINDNLRAAADQLNVFYNVPAFQVLLPVGISFYTFQSLSYSIDVYNNRRKPENHLGYLALYITFFPQLVAGPIERSSFLIKQLRQKFTFNYNQTTDGLKLITWGMIKKVVIADRLATFVDAVYDKPLDWSGVSIVIATLFFAVQIYCDFSGYTDIARGSAKLFGINLSLNFRHPYFAKSIPEFWRCWHITLSSWFKDYVYIPLGGNRVSKTRLWVNLYITFVLSGIWHGAAWTFILWGSLHGLYIILHQTAGKYISVKTIFGSTRLANLGKITLTIALVCFAWIFFRANSLSDAAYMATHLHTGWVSLGSDLTMDALRYHVFLNQRIFEFLIAVISIIALFGIEWMQSMGALHQKFKALPAPARFAMYYASIMLIVAFGFMSDKQFIYFQF